MDVKYGLLLKKSWDDLKNNLIIFLPLVYSILLMIILGLIVAIEVIAFIYSGFSFSKLATSVPMIASLVIVGLIDFILLMLMGSIVRAMNIRLLKDITTTKKAKANAIWYGVKKFTFLIFRLDLLKLVLIFGPLIILGLIVWGGFLIGKVTGIIFAVLFGGIGLLYLIAAGIALSIGICFLEPMMSQEKTNSAISLIKQALKYTKENLGHVFLTWIITFGISLVLQVIMRIMQFSTLLFIPLFLGLMFVFIIMGLIVSAYIQIFIFNSYLNKELKKY